MSIIRRNLDRHLTVIVLGLGLLFLSYSWLQTQQKLSRVEVNDFEGVIRLDYLDSALVFQRDSGSNRPLITAPGGFNLLEYSDRQSFITVNGNRSSLWDGDHGYVLDQEKHALYHTIRRDGWILTKEITLGPDNRQVKLNYYFLSTAGAAEVSLTLAHFHYYYQNPVVTSQGFSAEFSGLTREQLEQGETDRNQYRIRVSKGAETPGWVTYKAFSEASSSRFGLSNLLTSFEARPIPFNERNLIASELMQWEVLK